MSIFTSLGPSLTILILLFIVSGIILLQSINIILNKNILSPTLEDKLNSKIKDAQFKKDFSEKYRRFVEKVILFKTKYHLFFASKYQIEDMEIAFERTFQKLLPEDLDYITYKEYSAVNLIKSVIVVAISLIIILIVLILRKPFLITAILVIAILALVYINVLKLELLKSTIKSQNLILEKCFGDFYLCQHHILLKEHKNPFSKGLLLYKEKATNEYMKKWVSSALQMVRNTNEEVVIDRYLILYKDIYVLCNLLTIEKQIVQGADCSLLLKGLREEVIQKRTIAIDDNAAAVVNKAIIVRNVVFFIVFQVMIGAVVFFVLNGNMTL